MLKGDFETLLLPLIKLVRKRALDTALQNDLNQTFPANGNYCQNILGACRQGHADGWICEQEAGGIRYGRVIKPSPATYGFSVDVVEMRDIVGPHHAHPNGEIDLILPTTGQATFDRHPAGWLVYGPGSDHKPTVENGGAYILYLLPGGAITFIGA